jgi:predicted DNA binding protein
VLSKRERTAVTERDRATADVLPSGLTERQREALEAAYRAGYFDWPRETTAEEVAETLDIAASTLTAHLRKAEATLLTELFSAESQAD